METAGSQPGNTFKPGAFNPKEEISRSCPKP